MIENVIGIAREIVQDDDIKSKLPEITNFVTKLIEKQDNGSLSVKERCSLITFTLLLERYKNSQ
jgi:hypothetical protein